MKWKMAIRWTALVLALLVLVLLIGGDILIHTQGFNRFLIRKITQAAQQSTGEQVTIGKLVIHWGRPKADVYDLVFRKPSLNAVPFITCDHMAVGLKVLSFWGRQIALEELTLDHPALRIIFDRNGDTNLPHSNPPSTESSADKLFDLGIRHFALNSGEVDYNDETIPLAADLHDVRTQVQFNVAKQAYKGSLSYDRGRITARQLAPFDHRAQVEFEANRSAVSIKSLKLSTGDTLLTAEGLLNDYSNPSVQASYQAVLFTPDLARVLDLPSIPRGLVHTSGSLQYAHRTNRAFLDSVRVQGNVDSSSLDVNLAQLLARAQQIRAAYVLDHGNIDVSDIRATTLGGSVSGNFSMKGVMARPSVQLSASVRNASLADLTRVLNLSHRKSVTFAGRVNAELEAAWTGSVATANARLRTTISSPPAPPARDKIPLNGFLDVRYDAAHSIATFAPSNLSAQSTHVAFSGTIANRSSLTVQATAQDLAEVTQLISSLEPANANPQTTSLNSLDLKGSANFSGQISGSLKSPRIRGHLAAKDVAIKGTALSALQTDLDLSASALAVQNAVLNLPNRGQLKLNARADLHDWSLAPDAPVSIQANASNVSLANLERVASVQFPVQGILSASLSLHGSQNNPAGQASIDISNASAWGESLKRAAIHLQGDGNSIAAKIQLQVPAGPVSADINYSPKSQRYDGRIDAPKLELSKINLPSSRGLAVQGTASVTASGKGTIKEPQITAEVQIPQLQFQDQAISQVRAQLNYANQHASFTLNSAVIGGYAQAKGDIDLRGDYPATASVDVRALPIGALIASYLPSASNALQGHAELHATLTGPLKRSDEIKAQVQIPSLDIAYQTLRLGLADPARLEYANHVLSIANADIKGTGTNLSIRGTVPLTGARPLNVSANGSIDLGLLQSFSPSVKSSGQILLHVTASGSVSTPSMAGQIQVQNATFSSDTFPITLEGVNSQIRVTGNRLDIEQLNGMAGGGTLSVSGFLIYGKQTSFNLSAQAKSIRLRYPAGLRTVLDGNLNLTGTPDASSLNGRVLVDRLSFTQQFDMATLISQFSSDVPSTAPPAFEQNMKLNVALESSNQLNVSSSKLTIGGSANLNIAGTLADPVVLGRVVLTQGEVFFLGKRYEIQSGTIAFANPIRTEAVLNIYAKTTVQQYNITLNFVGPLDRLRTNYTSDPPLSEADIIHLVAFGTTAEEAATTSTPTSLAAESVLAQGVSSQLSGRLEKLTGISQITLDPLVTNSAADPASQIAIQERVSGSLLVTFSTDVTSTQYQTVQVEYRAAKNMMISVIRDYNGGYALDVRIRKTF